MSKSWASSETARLTMLANRRRDTSPEIAVRRLVHATGLRYRVDFRLDLRRRIRPDIVFTRARVAIFIDGCFWHTCPLHGAMPKLNATYWQPKLARTVARDREADLTLTEAGWLVLRYWEHEDPAVVANQIETAVRSRRNRQTMRTLSPNTFTNTRTSS